MEPLDGLEFPPVHPAIARDLDQTPLQPFWKCDRIQQLEHLAYAVVELRIPPEDTEIGNLLIKFHLPIRLDPTSTVAQIQAEALARAQSLVNLDKALPSLRRQPPPPKPPA